MNNHDNNNQNQNIELNDVQKAVVDLANASNNSKFNNKFFKHLKKFNFLYLNLLIWSILIIVVGICIAAGLQLI